MSYKPSYLSKKQLTKDVLHKKVSGCLCWLSPLLQLAALGNSCCGNSSANYFSRGNRCCLFSRCFVAANQIIKPSAKYCMALHTLKPRINLITRR